MANEPDDTDDGETFEEQFERMYQERVARDEKQKNRSKQPKDFGEFLDRVSDAVLDKIEERSAARRKEREEADEPPARGPGESKFAQWWGGGKQEAS